MKCDNCFYKDEMFVPPECNRRKLTHTEFLCKVNKKQDGECDKCGAYTKLKYTERGDFCEDCYDSL